MLNGSKRQRPDGKWQLIAELGKVYDPKTGLHKRKQAYETIGGTTRDTRLTEKEAERQLQTWLGELERGNKPVPDSTKMKAFLERWLRDVSSGHAVTTHENATFIIRKHWIPVLGEVRVQDVKPEVIQGAVGLMRTSGISPNSIRTYVSYLSSALAWAVELKLLASNPVDAVHTPNVQRPKHTAWNLEDIKAFQKVAEGVVGKDRVYAQALTLATQAGLRKGEIVALQRKDYDAELGSLNISQSSSRVSNVGIVFHDPKSQRGFRFIKLPKPSQELLNRVLEEQAKAQELAGKRRRAYRDAGLVFQQGDGSPLIRSRLNVVLDKLATTAGLERVKVHELRHSAATLMLDLGIDQAVAAEILGHDQRVLMDIYRAVKRDHKEEAAARLDAALGS